MLTRLVEMLADRAYSHSERPFKLVAGGESNHYIDCKKVTLCSEGQFIIGRLILDKIETSYIGGLTFGADAIATAVAAASFFDTKRINAFSVRKNIKDHGTGSWIEGDIIPGSRVTVAEDVVTTGASTIKALGRLLSLGYVPTQVVVLVQREKSGVQNIVEYLLEQNGIDPSVETITSLDKILDCVASKNVK